MNNVDLTNGLFELFSACLGIFNIHQIYKDEEVKGVSVVPMVFFTLWGFWNIFYYSYMGQYYSTSGAGAMLAVNLIYLSLVIKYKK